MNKNLFPIAIGIIAIIIIVIVIILSITQSDNKENINNNFTTNNYITNKTVTPGTEEKTIEGEKVNSDIDRIVKNDIPNLKIRIDWQSAPSQIDTYYFYDNLIVKVRNFNGEVMKNGSINEDIKTIYYFDENINMTSLVNYIGTLREDDNTYATIIITEKDGTTHGVQNADSSNPKPYSQLESAISEITNKASKIEDAKVITKKYE